MFIGLFKFQLQLKYHNRFIIPQQNGPHCNTMLCTFPKAFYQVYPSRSAGTPRPPHFSMRGPRNAEPNLKCKFEKLPLGKLLLVKFHILEVATCKFQMLTCLGSCTFGKLPLLKLHIWEIATFKTAHLELPLGKLPLIRSGNLKNCTFVKLLHGKVPLKYWSPMVLP